MILFRYKFEKGGNFTENFKKLDLKKQEEIISVAFTEFANNGYKNTSTTEIAKKSCIGKGTLFFYFNTKNDLYNYLIDYGISYLKTNFIDKISGQKQDFIERCKQISKLKLIAYTEKPYILNFFAKIYTDKDKQNISKNLHKRLDELVELMPKILYQNIDTESFRSDLDKETIMKLIKWCSDGYQAELILNLQRVEMSDMLSKNDTTAWQDYDKFLKNLKKIFYK